MANTELTIHVISHTHWDREWYRTKQQFRMELVTVVDAVLEALQEESGFRCFTLDGQGILLEDYLSMRPEKAETVRSLVRAGRLLVGPWYTQPDEFLVSGESMLRNLLAGIATAEDYGGAMRVGWVPDAFGHISQLPQIFRQLRIEIAALTRGIGNELPDMQTDFSWESRDGSRITVVHQVQGYYSGGLLGFPYFWGRVERHAPSPEIARQKMLRLVEPHRKRGASGHVALWNGADHLHPEPELGRTLEHLEEVMPGYRIVHSSVEEYVRNVRRCVDELPVVRGELRGSRYHPLLPSILSARIYLKQHNDRVQRLLERQAEPLSSLAALLTPAGRRYGAPAYSYPIAELRECWKLLLQNHGHDSIGGCSIDQVHREMLSRFDQSEQVATTVRRRALEQLSTIVDTSWATPQMPAFACFNPHDRAGFYVVTHEFIWSRDLSGEAFVVNAQGETQPTQVVHTDREEYAWLKQRIPAREALENVWWWGEMLARMDGLGVHRYDLLEREGYLELDLYLADLPSCSEQTIADLARTMERREPDVPVTVQAIFFRHRIMFESALPPVSLTSYSLETQRDLGRVDTGPQRAFTVSARDRELHFGGNRLSVEGDGSLRLVTKNGQEYANLAVLYSEGDGGDTYDFSPVGDGPLRLTPRGAISVEEGESGPVRASLNVSFAAELPAGLDASRSRRRDETVEIAVQLHIWVEMGSDLVYLEGSLENDALDHRVRVRVPAPPEAWRVFSDGQFSIEERSIEGPDTSGWAQAVTGIHPHANWVGLGDAEGAVCLHADGLHEHEVIETPDGPALELTLLRSVGWLSRGDLRTRNGQAGPMLPTPDAQCQGRNAFRFAFEAFPDESSMVHAVRLKGSVFVTAATIPAAPEQEGPLSELSLLSLDGTDFVLTAVHGSISLPGAPVLRFFNAAYHAVEQTIRVAPVFRRAIRVSFDERTLDYLPVEEGSISISAAGQEIVTLRLEPGDFTRGTA